MKLNKLTLKNFRGAKGEIPLTLDLTGGRSALIYGDNGTGKSSFTDAIEWIINSKVEHLTGEEVETNGALKNTFAETNDESYVEIEFDNGHILKKNISESYNSFKTKFNNPGIDVELSNLLESENLFIRNKKLVEFILLTSGRRLTDISSILGLQELQDTKEALTRVCGNLRRLLENKNYEREIARNKDKIFEKLDAPVDSKKELYVAITDQLKKLNIDKNVINQKTFTEALQELKKGLNQDDINKRNNINISERDFEAGLEKVLSATGRLSKFADDLQEFKSDKEKINNISIIKLLEEGKKIISAKSVNECPLCEIEIDREDLLSSVANRLEELKEIQRRVTNLNDEKESLQSIFINANADFEKASSLLEKINLDDIDMKNIEGDIKNIKNIEEALSQDILIADKKNLTLKDIDTANIKAAIQSLKNVEQLNEQQEMAKKTMLYSSIEISDEALDEIIMLKKEKEMTTSQKESMDKILSLFNEMRMNETNNFLNEISSRVNEYYTYMNHGRNIDEVRLEVNLKNASELKGISIKVNFHGKPVAPRKFLSESYLNCLGLCIFLASVDIFNNNAKFFVLDDVISSFDKRHRFRFARLLREKFDSYQIIILTHEKEWYEIMRNLVKGKNWNLLRTKWHPDEGIYLNTASKEMKEKLEEMLENEKEEGLGNLMRQYTEKCLKELCYSLKAKVDFHYDDTNEQRELKELFLAVVRVFKGKSSYLNENKLVVNRLDESSFIMNHSSHDSPFTGSIDELRAMYQYITEFYNLFYCESCKELVDCKYIDKDGKKISCKCKAKAFDWKE